MANGQWRGNLYLVVSSSTDLLGVQTSSPDMDEIMERTWNHYAYTKTFSKAPKLKNAIAKMYILRHLMILFLTSHKNIFVTSESHTNNKLL